MGYLKHYSNPIPAQVGDLKDQLRLVLTGLCSVFEISKLPWTADQTTVMVFLGPIILQS